MTNTQISVTQSPWTKLLRVGVTVGYRRTHAEGFEYSFDGDRWTQEAIPFDACALEITQLTASERVFHGDIVRLPPFSGAQEYARQVVLRSPEGTLYLYNLDTARIHPLLAQWPPPSSPTLNEISGTMYSDAPLADRINRCVSEAIGADGLHFQKLSGLLAAMLVSFALVVGLQVVALGEIGPVVSSLGPLTGAIIFFVGLRRWDWNALRREQMLVFGMQSGAILALAMALGYTAWASLLNDMFSLAGLAAYAGLSFFTGLIGTVIGGDLVAWRTGGYADDPTAPEGFRHSS